MTALRSNDDLLTDLARGNPQLIEAVHGRPTGVRLTRFLGAGGMATVFLGELEPGQRSGDLSDKTPGRLAVKFMQASTERQLTRMNMSPMDFFVRETVALGRVMESETPTEFVVGFYGSGQADVEFQGKTRRLPWLAIEFVDGGAAGASLTERVARAPEGVDPVRVLRLVRGVVEGVRALHAHGIIHRDLKPDNVLVAGPIDDETPKLADCGIARVTGLNQTVGAMTFAYGGPEQALSQAAVRNPLIGIWTDVHALAAVIWFVLGGEPWCVGDSDARWLMGERRSLRTAPRLHPAFATQSSLVDKLDAVLRRGASHRLPAAAWLGEGAERYAAVARSRFASMFAGPERYADLEAFAADLIPLLEEASARWGVRAVQENRAATAFRPTQLLSLTELEKGAPLAQVKEIDVRNIAGTETGLDGRALAAATPGCVVFQPDGKVLARFGDRLLYFVDHEPRKVGVPPEHRATVEQTKWLVRGPAGGFALVGPQHVLLIRGGRFMPMPLPKQPAGGEVGEIQAVVGDGRVFGVVTAETDDSNGGAELWRSTDGQTWQPPQVLPLGGDVHDIAFGPYGYAVAGSRRGTKGRALLLGLDDQITLVTTGVNDKPALRHVLCGATRLAWAVAKGLVIRIEKNAGLPETIDPGGRASPEGDEEPVGMGLDMVGVPWLVTTRTVLRRHVDGTVAAWKAYYRRDAARPALVGIGFTPDGAHVLDERGGTVELAPHDVASWRSTAFNQAG